MSDCPGCAEAEANPRTGLVYAGCLECSARSLAKSHPFWDSLCSETITPKYRAALQLVFGSDWLKGHASARKWAEKLATTPLGTT